MLLIRLVLLAGLGWSVTGCRAPEPATGPVVGAGFAPSAGGAESEAGAEGERIPGLALPVYDGLRHGLGVLDVRLGELGEVPSGFPAQLGTRLRSGLTESQRFVVVPRAELWKMRPGEPSATSVPPARHLVRTRLIQLEGAADDEGGPTNPDPDRPLRLLLQLELVDALQDETVASVTITGLSGRTPPREQVAGTPDARRYPAVTDPAGRQVAELTQDAADQAVRFLVQQMQTKAFSAWVRSPDSTLMKAAASADRESSVPAQATDDKARGGELVTLNRGERHRYPVGLRLTLIAPGRPLVDPSTGQPLGHSEARPVGEVQIVARSAQASVARVLEGGAAPPPGTQARVEP